MVNLGRGNALLNVPLNQGLCQGVYFQYNGQGHH